MKTPAAEPRDQNLFPGTNMVEGEKHLLKIIQCISVHVCIMEIQLLYFLFGNLKPRDTQCLTSMLYYVSEEVKVETHIYKPCPYDLVTKNVKIL